MDACAKRTALLCAGQALAGWKGVASAAIREGAKGGAVLHSRVHVVVTG